MIRKMKPGSGIKGWSFPLLFGYRLFFGCAREGHYFIDLARKRSGVSK